MKTFHLHLVSDATGETVDGVARACLVQFEDVETIEHVWPLIRTKGQIERVMAKIRELPGVVLFTLVDRDVRAILEDACHELDIPCISVLDPIVHALGSYFGATARAQPGKQYVMDAEYFSRIDAMNFALVHDDGQAADNLHNADVILLGVSRTAKTPTCIYLANRGIRAANIPIVPGATLPPSLPTLTRPLVVGLTRDPNQLIQIRRNRLLSLKQEEETDYVDAEKVKQEVAMARRYCAENNWPVIDVTRRSIEETTATILQLYTAKRRAALPVE